MDRLRPQPPAPAATKQSVLFVCIGNAVRSQMAEAFARKYGSDVMVPSSAGLYPAMSIAPLTWKVLRDRGIDIADHHPKSILEAPGGPWDVIVNISGHPLPRHILSAKSREWTVADPIGEPEDKFLAAANQIESLVMGLIIELRKAGGNG